MVSSATFCVTKQRINFTHWLKHTSTPMKDHIQAFIQRQEEVDYQCPGDIQPMTNTQINLAFMRSLGDDWKVFNQALGDNINAMKPAELYAQVQAYDDTENITRPKFSALTTFGKNKYFC